MILRTPEWRFARLPAFPFEPRYLTIADSRFGPLRMHYLDEGERGAPVVLCLHGQGCWSYLFRRVIPAFTAAGLRVVAPDYIGFGRSDKLPREDDYAFEDHVDWLQAFCRALSLRETTGFLFDWGGFFGLRLAVREPDLFARLVLMNTGLPKGDAPGREWFLKWRAQMLALPSFPQGEMVNDGVVRKLAPEIIAAFDAPYPDESYKAGPRRFPMILPVLPDDAAVPANRAAWDALGRWDRPVLTLFSASFAGTAMGPERLLAHLPGCAGQPHALLPEAGFYIVEDQPDELARRTVEFVHR